MNYVVDHLNRISFMYNVISTIDLEHPQSFISLFMILRRILLMEYLGTVIFGIGLQQARNDLDVQLVIMFAMLFSFRHSGAHYHMAVTLILMFRPHYPIHKFRGILQMLAGIFGFFTGASINYLLSGQVTSPRLCTYEHTWVIADLCGEILATTSFQFVNVVLFERSTQIFKVPLYNMSLLDFAIYYSRKLSPHSGGCMNPTIAIGFNLAVALIENRTDLLKYDLWVFVVGPMIGSIIVFIFYYGVVQQSSKLCRLIKSLAN